VDADHHQRVAHAAIGPVAPTTNAYAAPNVPVTNRNLNSTYDAAGNLTLFGSTTITYDANNMQTAAGSNTYAYDGLGQRVSGTVGSAPTTYYVYDAFGQLSAEYSAAPVTTPPCVTCYLSYDHLGSSRMVTNSSAQIIALHDYAPFGQEIPAGVDGRTTLWGAPDNVNQKFTGQERDGETNLDFFQARYMSSGIGRFNSPDPGNAGADLTNPQSWNGYGYVGGQPLVYTDPSGEDFGGFLNWIGGLFGFGSETSSSGATFYATGYCYGCSDPGPSGAGAPSHEGGGSPATGGGGPTFYGTGLYLEPVSTPSTASLQPPAKTATNPCAGRDPNRLDFYTPRYYRSENRTVSPYQHILDRHVRPNSKPGTTRYIFGFGPTQMNYTQTMSVVMSMGRTTFSNGFPVAQGNGNLLYRFGVPPIKISTPIGLFTLKGIGQDLSGNWLSTNSLVVEDNCESVVTEFPAKP
jgi:RHS repeat-associated protein